MCVNLCFVFAHLNFVFTGPWQAYKSTLFFLVFLNRAKTRNKPKEIKCSKATGHDNLIARLLYATTS